MRRRARVKPALQLSAGCVGQLNRVDGQVRQAAVEQFAPRAQRPGSDPAGADAGNFIGDVAPEQWPRLQLFQLVLLHELVDADA